MEKYRHNFYEKYAFTELFKAKNEQFWEPDMHPLFKDSFLLHSSRNLIDEGI